MLGYGLIVFAAAVNAAANILLKLAVDRGISLSIANGIGAFLVHHWYLILGLVLFVLNVAIYLIALRVLPLSVAYPTMLAVSFMVIGTVSVFLLGEHMTLVKVVGYACIILGIVLVSGLKFF